MAIARELGDTETLAYALLADSWVSHVQGDTSRQRPSLEEALGIYRREGNRWGLTAAGCSMGIAMMDVEDPAAEETLLECLEIADQIGANGPLAVKAVLRSLRETEGVPEEEALKIELEIGMAVFATNDAKEGPRAFAEKRPAHFTGT